MNNPDLTKVKCLILAGIDLMGYVPEKGTYVIHAESGTVRVGDGSLEWVSLPSQVISTSDLLILTNNSEQNSFPDKLNESSDPAPVLSFIWWINHLQHQLGITLSELEIHKYFDMAYKQAENSTCTRRKVGAVVQLVNNKKEQPQFLMGCNRAPHGIPNCTKATCLRTVNKIPSGKNLDICVALHAEQDIIVQAAREGISLKGAILYCTTSPCPILYKTSFRIRVKGNLCHRNVFRY